MKNKMLTLLILMTCELQHVSAEIFHFHFENTLGTSLELQIDVEQEQIACQIKEMSLLEIDRLSQILSSYIEDSEFNRWQRREIAGNVVSPELSTVLRRAEYWRQETAGAFDIRVEYMQKLWRQAEIRGEFPSSSERHRLLHALSDVPYQLDSEKEGEANPEVPVSLNALAKGFILDQVCQKVRQKYPRTNFMINIGGDIRKIGDSSWTVNIENPFVPHTDLEALMQINIAKPWAVATSGNYRRGYRIGTKLQSHIIDPRTGLPAMQISSATVLAPTGMDADALATAFSVMSVSQSIRLAESRRNIECLLILKDGRVISSSGWPNRQTELTNINVLEPTKNTGLKLSFSLNRPEGGRYRRPYVAIWLEDKDGFPVKTALLWLQVEQPGPRWHRDLTRWYRKDRSRKLVESVDLIKTVAGATRGPGKYETHFDGTDNSGKLLPSGQYTLCIEVAREHGTYQIIRKPLELGIKPIPSTKIAGNIEVGNILYEYTPPITKAN